MKRTAQDHTQWWHRSLSWMTSTTSQPHRCPQTIILQLLLLMSIIACIAYALIYFASFQHTPVSTLWALTIFTILYATSRTRFYNVAIIAFISFLLVQPYMMEMVAIYRIQPLFSIIFSMIAVPFTLLLFTGRMRIVMVLIVEVISIVTFVIFTIIGFVQPQVTLPLALITCSLPIIYQIIVSAYATHGGSATHEAYYDLIDHAPDMMALAVQGNIVYINPAGISLLGLSDAKDLIGKPLDSIIIKSNYDPTDSNKYVTRSNHSGEMVVESVENIDTGDGHTIRAWVTMMPFDLDGILATSITIKPIPQFINQPEAILESADALTTVQQNGKIVYINGYFERLTGYNRQEVYSIDYNRLQYTHEGDRERVNQWLQGIFNGENQGEPIEYRMYHKNRSVIWVKTSGSLIRYAGKPAILTTTFDITSQQTKTQSVLAQENIPFSWLMAKTHHNKTTIVSYHQGDEDWFEDETALVGMMLSDIIIDLPKSLSTIFDFTADHKKTYRQRNMLKRANGKMIPIEWIATPLEDNTIADHLIIVRPTTDDLMIEEELLRYRAMFDMMNDYAFLLKVLPNNSYEFVWVNNAFEMITGYNPHVDTANDMIKQMPYPDDKVIVKHHFEQLLQGEMSVVEYRIVTKSGIMRWVREHAYPVVEDNQTTLIYGSVSDITDFVKSEEALKNIALQQAVVAEIGMVAANATLDIPSFSNQILNLVTQLMTVSWCVLIEYHPDKEIFTTHSIVGQSVSGEIESKPDDKYSYLGYVLDQNDPVVVRDWSKESRFKPPKSYETLGIQTSLSVVVPMQDKPFGILNVHDVEPRTFSGEHINLLQTIANLIGTYIQQRQTQTAEREHRMMAEALINIATVLNSATELEDVLQFILGFVSEIVPVVDSSNLMLIDNEKQVATIAIRHTVSNNVPDAPPGREIPLEDIPLFVKIVESGKTLVLNNVNEVDEWHIVPETNWVQSYLGAPIFAGEDCIGVLSLDSAQINAFTPQHVQQLQAFLNQASIAIRNARHAEELAQEIKNATQDLQSERVQLQAILDATGEGIFYSVGYDMLFTNKALANMMGYTQAELQGQSSHLFRPDDLTEEELRVRDNIQYSLRTRGIHRADIRFKRKDGSHFIGGVTASRISMTDDMTETVTVVRDINKEKVIEAQKETFISNAAHELRNPITTLNTRIYIMKNKEVVTKADVEKMDVVVQKMNALVSGLLDVSRFDSGRIQLNLQSVILQMILDEVMEFQLPEAEKKRQALHATAPEEPMTMVADSLRLNQVLTNLVSNSINYTQDGGTIDVVIAYTDETLTEIKIEVIDNGIGIDKESMETIFTPFSQAHNNNSNSGTGLGLSISKQIVEAHGGRIDVESAEGVGSRFIVHLPTVAIIADD